MGFMYKYITPEGFDNLIMNSDGEKLTALCFEASKDVSKLDFSYENKLIPIFEETLEWLDIYFSGKNPGFIPKYDLHGVSPFRRRVTDIISEIPYGKTVTYGEIAKQLAENGRMSAQAVGGAVGANPICIIIPCHRVVGANGSMTGYGGGIQNKIGLLRLEGFKF